MKQFVARQETDDWGNDNDTVVSWMSEMNK